MALQYKELRNLFRGNQTGDNPVIINLKEDYGKCYKIGFFLGKITTKDEDLIESDFRTQQHYTTYEEYSSYTFPSSEKSIGVRATLFFSNGTSETILIGRTGIYEARTPSEEYYIQSVRLDVNISWFDLKDIIINFYYEPNK